MLSQLLMPLLRYCGPEQAHRLALRTLRLGLAGRDSSPDPPAFITEAFGLRFRNPIGLAAGFDKDAVAIDPLGRLGFGFVETGTVTPRPQPGNAPPRIFRLAEDGAIINRMGFNGGGLEAYLARLQRKRERRVIVGANIGINRDCTTPEIDYPALVAAVAPIADYVVINVSSPNTPGLRALQAGTRLGGILRAIAERATPIPPLLVKIAPDLTDPELAELVEVCISTGVHGLIVGNTTSQRPPTLRSPYAKEAGGLSGRPLFALSTAILARAYQRAQGRLILIGCGGISTGEDVLTKIKAGATLVQLYTAFIYGGPYLIQRIKRELVSALRRDGFSSVAQAVGVDAAALA